MQVSPRGPSGELDFGKIQALSVAAGFDGLFMTGAFD